MDILSDVRRALIEDIGSGDITASLLPEDYVVNAVIIARESLLVCGRPWVDVVFAEVDNRIQVTWCVDEGSWQDHPGTLCQLQGPVRSILTAERTALNFMQTLSGTATTTHHYIQALHGHKTRLLDTRKTIPGLREAQKYAVRCAGAENHRMGLYDAFLIKENHIKAVGSITAAILSARSAFELKHGAEAPPMIEVEVETLDELQEALNAKPDRIMLDNFTHDMIIDAVAMNQSTCILEVSGGVDMITIAALANTGVDYISVGALTKSVRAIDLSLLIQDAV